MQINLVIDPWIVSLCRWIGVHLFGLFPRPEPAVFTLSEVSVGLVYKISLPVSLKPTVVKHVLTYGLNSKPSQTVEYAVGSTENYLSFVEGDVVTHSIQQVDANGNVSPPSAPVTFTAKDTLPMAAPESAQFTLIKVEA